MTLDNRKALKILILIAGIFALLGLMAGDLFWAISTSVFITTLIIPILIHFQKTPTILGTFAIFLTAFVISLSTTSLVKYVLIGSIVINTGKELLYKGED